MSHETGHHPNIVSRELFDAVLAEWDEARVRVRELEEDNERLQKDRSWFQTLASVLAKQAICIYQLEAQSFGALVQDAGGGVVKLVVDRDTME